MASQAVLEGLNALLDHRGTIFIPEIGREIPCPAEFRIFGCQNPILEGGGRKGLPKSFLNRFTQIFIEGGSHADHIHILSSHFSSIPRTILSSMVTFNDRIHRAVEDGSIGRSGGPWEFNLRDLFRWCDLLLLSPPQDGQWRPDTFLDLLYLQRMRVEADREKIVTIFREIFSDSFPSYCKESGVITFKCDSTLPKIDSLHEDEVISSASHTSSFRPLPHYRRLRVLPHYCQIESSFIARSVPLSPYGTSSGASQSVQNLSPLRSTTLVLDHLMKCIEMNWMPILVGGTASGKTSAVRFLAALKGVTLHVFSMNSSVDTMELLGGFEQVEEGRYRKRVTELIGQLIGGVLQCLFIRYAQNTSRPMEDSGYYDGSVTEMIEIVDLWQSIVQNHLSPSASPPSPSEIETKYGIVVTLLDMIHRSCVRHSIPLLRRPSLSSELDETIYSDLIVKVSASSPTISDGRDALDNWRRVSSGSMCGRFEWVDGMLLRAVKEGHWLLIDNVNFCSPAVLDRLNPLVETNGYLIVNERGATARYEKEREREREKARKRESEKTK